MPPPIKKLADKFLENPKMIEVARPASTNINIKQWVVPVAGSTAAKRDRLRQILAQEEVTNAIVFCNRKTTVRELNKTLKQAGFKSGEIHGDMEQAQRIAELDLFKDGHINILVASDVAARGLDIKGVSTVFNFDAPWHPDDYVHRIGRTGRAGATGTAYTFVAPDDDENIANIEKLTGQQIPRLDAPVAVAAPVAEAPAPREERPRRNRRERPAPEAVRDEPVRDEAVRDVVAPVEAPVAPRVAAPSPAREDRRPERQEREPRRDYRRNQVDDGPDDGWNGPIPAFLNARLVIQP